MAPPKGHGGGRPRRDRNEESSSQGGEFNEPIVVRINRSAAVVKGGRRFSFSALVVVGNGRGKVGMGYAKGKEVASAVEKATKDAKRNLVVVPRAATTLPHEVIGVFSSSKVCLRPAEEGRGVIACAAIRAVIQSAGISDVVTKSMGNPNPINLVKATFDAIAKLKTRDQIEALRGVKLS